MASRSGFPNAEIGGQIAGTAGSDHIDTHQEGIGRGFETGVDTFRGLGRDPAAAPLYHNELLRDLVDRVVHRLARLHSTD